MIMSADTLLEYWNKTFKMYFSATYVLQISLHTKSGGIKL